MEQIMRTKKMEKK